MCQVDRGTEGRGHLEDSLCELFSEDAGREREQRSEVVAGGKRGVEATFICVSLGSATLKGDPAERGRVRAERRGN